MRNQLEIEVAAECLSLAHDPNAAPEEAVARAERYFAFVMGDDSKEKLAAVSAIINPCRPA